MADFSFSTGLSPVKFYQPAFDNFKGSPDGEIGKNLHKRGIAIVQAAKRQVGVDTRELQSSIHMIHRRRGTYQELWIGSEVDHALVHHEGARPHQINARNANFLRFSSRGRIVYTRSVQHPGTPANKYLSDNLYLAYK